jgi:hypothetical protein
MGGGCQAGVETSADLLELQWIGVDEGVLDGRTINFRRLGP